MSCSRTQHRVSGEASLCLGSLWLNFSFDYVSYEPFSLFHQFIWFVYFTIEVLVPVNSFPQKTVFHVWTFPGFLKDARPLQAFQKKHIIPFKSKDWHIYCVKLDIKYLWTIIEGEPIIRWKNLVKSNLLIELYFQLIKLESLMTSHFWCFVQALPQHWDSNPHPLGHKSLGTLPIKVQCS